MQGAPVVRGADTETAVLLMPDRGDEGAGEGLPFAVGVEMGAATTGEFTTALADTAQVLHALAGDATLCVQDEDGATTTIHLPAGASTIVPPNARRNLTGTYDVLCTLLPASFLKTGAGHGGDDAPAAQRTATHAARLFGWHAAPHRRLGSADVQRMLNDDKSPNATNAQKPTTARRLSTLPAYRVPRQTNRLTFFHDPVTDPRVRFTYGLEIFEPGHQTPRHTHRDAHELFLVLAGDGGRGVFRDPNARNKRGLGAVSLAPGDVVVFPPGLVHAIDNGGANGRLYTLQLMAPNDAFAERVQSGEALASLEDEGRSQTGSLCTEPDAPSH